VSERLTRRESFLLSHCIGSASTALGFGLLAGAALPLGAALGTFWKLPERAVAGVMAFGAGTLIAALALVLMEDAHRHGGLLFAALGFLAGAVLYTIADALIKRLIGMRRRAAKQAEQSGVAIAVGSLMDNVPEGVVIGIGVLSGGASPALLAAVFLSNLPEALASAARMREAGHHAAFILGIWSAIGVLCGLAAWAGFLVFRSFSDAGIAIASAVAAGAIVAMLVDTLIPEAYEGAHDYSGLVTAAGFLLAFALHKTSA
jgi:ZIP family zinc transporter